MKQASVVDVAHSSGSIVILRNRRLEDGKLCGKKKNQILTLRKTEARRTNRDETEARGERNTMFTFACYKCYADELSSS